ncbi:MAG: hypothetical protein ACREM1_18880 [Longimicrobiales bacterium]
MLLKAARLAAEGVPLFLLHVDVLVPHGLEVALARRLESLGHDRLAPDFEGAKHLRERRLRSSIPLEIHSAVLGMSGAGALIDAAVPCKRTRSLRRLSNQHPLEHILFHILVHHPVPRGEGCATRRCWPDRSSSARTSSGSPESPGRGTESAKPP